MNGLQWKDVENNGANFQNLNFQQLYILRMCGCIVV